MDYPCAKFGDFSFSRFGFIVLTDRHRRMIAILEAGTQQSANSRRLLDRLQYVFALCDPVTLTFDLLI